MGVFWKFVGVIFISTTSAFADVNYTGGTYSQNFDSLATSGTVSWLNNSSIAGWYLFRQPVPGTPVTSYIANGGGGTTGSFYSYGTTSERALGGQGSGGTYFGSPSNNAVAGWISVGIQNGTGLTIDSFTVSFDGEQWRNAGNATPQTMVMEYGFGSSFTTVSSWNAPGGGFDWTSVVNTATAAAVDGNTTGLVSGVGGTITGLSWAAGDTLFIRWIERNDAGNDHGLAIDNFAFSATAVPEPASAGLLALASIAGLAFRRRRS